MNGSPLSLASSFSSSLSLMVLWGHVTAYGEFLAHPTLSLPSDAGPSWGDDRI